jgi:ATP-dependent 26S proteasome regulatory subunit
MKLTVKPIKQKDAGRRLAAIDRVAADELDLSGGDFIRLDSDDGTAIARVWPGYPEDDGTGVVRIDGRLRSEAGVGIDDTVAVEPADIQPADRITIALPQRLGIRGNIDSLIHRELGGQPVTQGQSIRLPLGFGFMGGQSQAVPLKIASTTPSGTVVITDDTTVEIAEQPAEQIADAPGAAADGSTETPNVAYEDIGGLDEELEQVREMIELPMRHPELFKRLGIDPPKGVLLTGRPELARPSLRRLSPTRSTPPSTRFRARRSCRNTTAKAKNSSVRSSRRLPRRPPRSSSWTNSTPSPPSERRPAATWNAASWPNC